MMSSVLQAFVPRVLVMYVIAAAAFLFYVSKVPERYFPGEILTHLSHQFLTLTSRQYLQDTVNCL